MPDSSDSRLPPTIEYTKKSYWDSRFTVESEYDWLCTYPDLKPLLDPLISDLETTLGKRREELRVLLVGTGTSALPRDLAADGYRRVVATDYSETLVSRCLSEQGDYAGCVEWKVADMLDLSEFADEGFDCVLDKAAMDAVLAVGGDSWDLDPVLLTKTDRILSEANRVLRKGGLYVQVTFSQPHFRRRYLESEGAGSWTGLKRQTIERGLGYFLFSMWRV